MTARAAEDRGRHARARGRGVTLLELLTAVGLLLLLAALTISAWTAVVRAQEVRRTETALAILDSAMREWEHHADRSLTWWQKYADDGNAYWTADVHSDTPEVLIITEMMDVVLRHEVAERLVARLDESLVHRYEPGEHPPWIRSREAKMQVDERFAGSITILDAWGTPVYATHPGRVFNEATDLDPMYPHYSLDRDPDGTIRTYNEEKYGVAAQRRIVFVSAGPDRLFGLPEEFGFELTGEALADALAEARADNLYSTPVTFADEPTDE